MTLRYVYKDENGITRDEGTNEQILTFSEDPLYQYLLFLLIATILFAIIAFHLMGYY